jgi:hypothetical protein
MHYDETVAVVTARSRANNKTIFTCPTAVAQGINPADVQNKSNRDYSFWKHERDQPADLQFRDEFKITRQ